MADPEEITGSSPNTKARSPIARIGLVLVSLFAGWHIFASFLWISPPSQLRTLVPGDALSSYMIPWFGQSWSVFAPEPINGDYRLEVRAIIAEEAEPGAEPEFVATEWISATDVELSKAQYNLFPPRAAILATQQASKTLNQWKKLNAEQKEIAALGYYEGDDWLGRMQVALNEAGEDMSVVTDYIVQERYTSAYATQVAFAVWGEDRVQQVQFAVSRQNIIPFADRHNPDAKRPKPEVANTGWRGTLVMPMQSNEDFAETFLKSYKGVIDE